MYKLDFHGDDYAISVNNSKRMIELIESGRLNSISIIANMGCFDECMSLLHDKWDGFKNKPLISVHINLIDGYLLSSDNPNIIQDNSWGNLFIRSLFPFPGKKAYKNSLSTEISTQIKRVFDSIKDLKDDNEHPVSLRLDSHVHTHMIPLIFDAMTDALNSLNMSSRVSYIRNSCEPIKIFFKTPGVKGTFPAINLIKNLILNILGKRVLRYCHSQNIDTGMLWGLMLSGNMDRKRIDILLPKMSEYARKKDSYLEVLCHPGIVLIEEKRPEYGKDDLASFFSKNRDAEYDMIMNHTDVY